MLGGKGGANGGGPPCGKPPCGGNGGRPGCKLCGQAGRRFGVLGTTGFMKPAPSLMLGAAIICCLPPPPSCDWMMASMMFCALSWPSDAK